MRISEPGNTVYLDVGVWFNDDQNNIHLIAKGVEGFHTTINADLGSKRCHPNLYYKLARVLRDAGAPHPSNPDDDT